MLSYTFWHWRQPAVPAADYETRQRAFHAALAADPPPGFARSSSVALAGAPWANSGGDAYEDWYLVRDFPDLGPLNDFVMKAPRVAAHDAAAAVVAGGAAGLYRVMVGDAPSAAPRSAQWFAKPGGVRYDQLFAAFRPVVERTGATLWMRQMVLGPTPEFCLRGDAPAELPLGIIAAHTLPLRAVWPERAAANELR